MTATRPTPEIEPAFLERLPSSLPPPQSVADLRTLLDPTVPLMNADPPTVGSADPLLPQSQALAEVLSRSSVTHEHVPAA